MNMPQTIRFRVVEDVSGISRLAFCPIMVPGREGFVRVMLHPRIGDGSQSSQRIGVEQMEVLWAVYKKAPIAVFSFDQLVAEPLGV